MNTPLSGADASFVGGAHGERAGDSVAGAGDVNGDGYDDILIGAHYNNEGGNNAGKVYLIFGKESGWEADLNLTNANASFIGEAVNNEAGISVAGVGDVNGDNFDDFIIGASGFKKVGSGQNYWGRAYLFYGRSDGWNKDVNISSANASFTGEKYGSFAGFSVAGAGDVNNDSYNDLLIGAFRYDNGVDEHAGRTYLIFGNSTPYNANISLSEANVSYTGEFEYDQAGYSVAGVGDVNGDEYDDILIAANQYNASLGTEGKIYLIFGNETQYLSSISLSNANASFIGEAQSDYAGTSIAGAGDVNNDSYYDILIGAPDNDQGGYGAGQTYLILGRSSGWNHNTPLSNVDGSFVGASADDNSGDSVSGSGDINGDGYDDILVGANEGDKSGNSDGKVYLFLDFNYTTTPSGGVIPFFPITSEDAIPSFPSLIFLPIMMGSILIGALLIFRRKSSNILA